MFPILIAKVVFIAAIYAVVTVYPPALYWLYIFFNIIIDAVFVTYILRYASTPHLPEQKRDVLKRTKSSRSKRWIINTWRWEKSLYVLFTLYSFISGVISFALICVYTINFCMSQTLVLVDFHFDHSEEINRKPVSIWIVSIITIWIYQLYQSDYSFFKEIKHGSFSFQPLKQSIDILCTKVFPLSWILTFIYLGTLQNASTKVELRGAALTVISLYFVIYFTVFVALHSLSLLWYNYGDHEDTFFNISDLITIPKWMDIQINPARFWRILHFVITIIFEGVEIAVTGDINFSRDYVDKFCKWMAIQGLSWCFVYFMAQCVTVCKMNYDIAFDPFQAQPKEKENKWNIKGMQSFLNNGLMSTGPFDEALLLVFFVFCLERYSMWASGTFIIFMLIKYMKWYDSAWSLANCFNWWFVGKYRQIDQRFSDYWQERKAIRESFNEFNQETKASRDFNRKIIWIFFSVFIVSAILIGIQITPYFKKQDVQTHHNVIQDITLQYSAKEINEMSLDEYMDMINKSSSSSAQKLMKLINDDEKPNDLFVSYPVCGIEGAYNHLNALDLIMFTLIPYLETEEEHKKLLQVWFGDIYEYIYYNPGSPSFFHIKYNKPNDYPYDVIAIRGTKKIHDFTQDLLLFTEVASLQVVSWLFPLTSFLPEPFLQWFIDFTSWDWQKLISWSNGEKYTLFYHQIEQYMRDNMTDALSKDKGYNNSIYVVGHSLGGGISEIVAATFAHDGYSNVFSFGLSSPGVSLSSQKFDISDDGLDKTSISIIPRRDIVPKIDRHGGLKQQIGCQKTSFVDCHYGISSFCEILNSCSKLIQDPVKERFAHCMCLENIGFDYYNSFCYGGSPRKQKETKKQTISDDDGQKHEI